MGGISSDGSDDESDASEDDRPKPSPNKRRKQSSGAYKSTGDASDENYQGDESDDSYSDGGMEEEELANSDNFSHERKGRKRYKRLDAHSRDGRWYPSYAPDNGDDPMEGEDETWNDLKDVVSSDPLYQTEGGVSITSRLRSSVLSQDMNTEQDQVEVEESPLVLFDNVLVPTDVTPTDEITI